ncbi:MAG: outer membrane lipoprotein carrier protein LolA [Pedobacter sp.]
MTLWRFLVCGLALLPVMDVQAGSLPQAPGDANAILERLKTAYAGIGAYQIEVETSEYQKSRLVATRRFRFSFQKPGRLRIDMHTPHPGMRLVYPDENGKVWVRFGGWMEFVHLRLAPDNALFATRSGQRIDQSDIGLLIRNIGRSLTDQSYGALQVTEQGRQLRLDVVAADHFLSGVTTRYLFVIDKTLWLPVAVEERTPAGQLRRRIDFRQLRIDPVFPEHFFDIDKEDSTHETSSD